MTKCKHKDIEYFDNETTYYGKKTVEIPKGAHFCDDCERIVIVEVRS